MHVSVPTRSLHFNKLRCVAVYISIHSIQYVCVYIYIYTYIYICIRTYRERGGERERQRTDVPRKDLGAAHSPVRSLRVAGWLDSVGK